MAVLCWIGTQVQTHSTPEPQSCIRQYMCVCVCLCVDMYCVYVVMHHLMCVSLLCVHVCVLCWRVDQLLLAQRKQFELNNSPAAIIQQLLQCHQSSVQTHTRTRKLHATWVQEHKSQDRWFMLLFLHVKLIFLSDLDRIVSHSWWAVIHWTSWDCRNHRHTSQWTKNPPEKHNYPERTKEAAVQLHTHSLHAITL